MFSFNVAIYARFSFNCAVCVCRGIRLFSPEHRLAVPIYASVASDALFPESCDAHRCPQYVANGCALQQHLAPVAGVKWLISGEPDDPPDPAIKDVDAAAGRVVGVRAVTVFWQ